MLRLQNTILEMVAKGESLERTASRLCLEIEKIVPGVICSLLTVDDDRRLRPLAAPSLPDHYTQALDGLAIGPVAGSCGTAAYLGEPIEVRDIARDPLWDAYRHLALPLDLKACWSSPILDSRGQVLGTFAFYYQEPRGPNRIERHLVATCVNLCTIAMERHGRVAERERQASVDGLTGLANRFSFNGAIADLEHEAPGTWALLLVDLDNLKVVNDTFGHQAGDALIVEIGRRIEAACHPGRVYRIGGDEFAVILQAPDVQQGLDALADAIQRSFAVPAECNGHLVQPQATMGGAVRAAADAGTEAVRQNADFALYHAKETARGGFVRYSPGIGTAITQRLSAIRDVQTALRERRVQAYYQPVVSLDTREIVGLEALCRITTTDGRVIPASEFCEATADAHVASAVTETMLACVAADMRRWIDLGIGLGHVSVNISSADFHLGRLHEQVTRALEREQVPLQHLIVEVTEDVYLGQRDNVVARAIHAMRRRGLRVALDDFGTGFASLTHLLTVPVDIIKIDRSFVTQLAPDNASSVIIEGLFGIADKLGIAVVAEGIETEDQAFALDKFGCTLGQGYLFSPPVHRDAATELLAASAHRRKRRSAAA